MDQPLSQVLELIVNTNNECEVIWEYNLPQELYTNGRGSVQLLENDNYLITASVDKMIEVTPEKDIIWQAD